VAPPELLSILKAEITVRPVPLIAIFPSNHWGVLAEVDRTRFPPNPFTIEMAEFAVAFEPFPLLSNQVVSDAPVPVAAVSAASNHKEHAFTSVGLNCDTDEGGDLFSELLAERLAVIPHLCAKYPSTA
jgi:hypothetical protein